MYFSNCNTVDEIKARFKELARKHHPDLGGDTETMKQINLEYQQALKGCHGKTQDGDRAYHYDQDLEDQLMAVIESLIGLGMDDVEITLIGVWVWVSGNTKPHKDRLKQLGLKWHSKRLCWFFATENSKRFCGSSNASLDELGAKYGKKEVKTTAKKSMYCLA